MQYALAKGISEESQCYQGSLHLWNGIPTLCVDFFFMFPLMFSFLLLSFLFLFALDDNVVGVKVAFCFKSTLLYVIQSGPLLG